MAGAANSATGNITIREISQDAIQFGKKRPLPSSG
jgi:hypothetical protein